MAAKEDLQAVAAKLAAVAREHSETGEPIRYESLRMAGLAEGARAALEAAALVDVDPAPIEAAIASFYEVAFPGVEIDEGSDGIVDRLANAARVVANYREFGQHGAAVAVGYDRLRTLVDGLERDFTASKTDTAQRIATRIRGAREEAELAINAALKGQEENHG